MQEPTVTTPSSSRAGPWGGRFTESNASGVSWAAIFAGAAAAAALSLILTILGFGLGLSAISPWGDAGASATTLGISTAIWLALVQIASAGLGGYLAGRLRVRWAGLHTDEVYFRDTAHGMLSWAIATLVTAAFLGSALTGAVGTSVQAAGKALGGVTQMAGQAAVASQAGDEGGSGILSYYVDGMFRSDEPVAETPAAASREAAAILANSLRTGQLSDPDRTYLGKLVAQRTQLSQADAEKRVTDTYNEAVGAAQELEDKAKEAADTARKAAAGAALWFFVALLCGAFFASLFAIYGGRHRDAVIIDATAYE